ncbi:MAG: hypothetical protein COA95_10545 [Methylophaga sp.]|nr:MAG: hypothetical protein COA95_10545 [Methylophaga sp.]
MACLIAVHLALFLPIVEADVAIPPIPIEPLYFEPPIVEATQEDKQLNCVELDKTIRYLHPYRYTYKDKFYEDNMNVVAATVIASDFIPLIGLGYLTYSSMVEEKENRRMLNIEQKISMLQQLKSELHCFE